ncbi:MAG: PAS domain S-box protein [Spartobacteria bacterium]|nr:PAS domain S-box protein [Spartobacteria bacterium]
MIGQHTIESNRLEPSTPSADDTLCLLLLENDAESGNAMKLMLERRGMVVTHVTSVAEALDTMQSMTYDAAVADIRLEGRSGVEYLREVRLRNADFPVVLLTGYDSLDSAIQAIRLGAQDYILKPLNSIEDLLIPVRKAITNYRLFLRNQALEKELIAREKHLTAIFDNAAVGIVLFNQSGNIIQVNNRALDMLGYKPEDIARVRVQDIIKPSDMKDVQSRFRALCRNRISSFQVEKEVVRKDGNEVWSAISVSSIRDENNVIAAHLGILTDIDEQKRMARELRESQEQLIQSEKLAAIGQLAAGIAHELNQPLTHINITAQLIERMVMDNITSAPPVRREVRVIQDNVVRATSVIRSLRDFSRKDTTPPEPIDVQEVIHAALSMFSGELTKKGITVDVRLPEQPLQVIATTNQLVQVLVNLIGNARDALLATTENPSRHIIISACEQDDQALIRVEDNGAGIPEEVMPHIFTPFYTTKEVGKGTGLGLSVSLQIIKSFNGTLNATSSLGHGVTMSITLEKAAPGKEIHHE